MLQAVAPLTSIDASLVPVTNCRQGIPNLGGSGVLHCSAGAAKGDQCPSQPVSEPIGHRLQPWDQPELLGATLQQGEGLLTRTPRARIWLIWVDRNILRDRKGCVVLHLIF